MSKKINPGSFGLHHATHLEQTGAAQFTLVIDRKSRIVMKDGRNILAKAAKIITKIPEATVRLRTTAPICSKTKALLSGHKIEIE